MNIFLQNRLKCFWVEVRRFHIETLYYVEQNSKCMLPAAQKFPFSSTMRYYFMYKGSQYSTLFQNYNADLVMRTRRSTDLGLLIISVISLYVGCFKSNTFKASLSFFIQAGNSNFRFFVTC